MTEIHRKQFSNNDLMSPVTNTKKFTFLDETPQLCSPETIDNEFAYPVKNGKAKTELQFLLDNDIPDWSAKTKTAIVNGYKQGLKQNKATTDDVNCILKKLNISSLEINEKTIQDSAYSPEIIKIQEYLNQVFDKPDLKVFGNSHTIPTDGKFSRDMVTMILALNDLDRGKDVSVDINPIKQVSPVGCYFTSEAMFFNAIHQKTGTNDAYTEFDTRARINSADLVKENIYINATSENSKGRLTIARHNGIALVNKIDNELNQNPPRPVITGISYRKQNGDEYNEGITDHFVLINGRGTDNLGPYYTFADPAQGGTGKLRFDPFTGKLTGKGDMAGIYDVSMISLYELKPEATENYKKMSKVLYYPGFIGPEMKDIQKKLKALGFDTKGVDGKFGNATETVIKQIQTANKLPVTGKIDTFTLDAIEKDFIKHQKENPAEVIYAPGENTPVISELQSDLNKLGFKTNGTTGLYGRSTENAVIAFQKANKLPVSGKIDNQTWLTIAELVSAK
jgi:peptidoglycan hydrolase-like protein with peptidoglycan-binding domain